MTDSGRQAFLLVLVGILRISYELDSDKMWNCLAVDCGDPGTPANGVRSLTTTTLGSVVLYECNRGFVLDGSSSRLCQATGVWSGLLPVCRGW